MRSAWLIRRLMTQKRCDNWELEIQNTSIDLKHLDTDGNGLIESYDTLAISENYHKDHSLIAEEVYKRGDFPMVLKILTPNVDSGDIGIIEVQFGDSENPAIDILGYSYELDYNLKVVNENSLSVDYYEDGWFPQHASSLNMFKKPWDGRLESGAVRAGPSFVSGRGGVEALFFIVEDEITGFRNGGAKYAMEFYFSDIKLRLASGETVLLDDVKGLMYLNLEESETPVLDQDKLIVFPNPAQDYLRVILNGKNYIEEVSIISGDGRVVETKRVLLIVCMKWISIILRQVCIS